jgi:hypothetical protein
MMSLSQAETRTSYATTSEPLLTGYLAGMPCQFLWPEMEKAFGPTFAACPEDRSHDIDFAYPQ